jgi:hypothetical protein
MGQNERLLRALPNALLASASFDLT